MPACPGWGFLAGPGLEVRIAAALGKTQWVAQWVAQWSDDSKSRHKVEGRSERAGGIITIQSPEAPASRISATLYPSAKVNSFSRL